MEELLLQLTPLTPTEEEMERWFQLEQTIDIYANVDRYMDTSD